MPRGVKGSGKAKIVKPINERIDEIDAVIASLQVKLAEAKAKRKELTKAREQLQVEELQKIIQESGLTPDELKDLIKNK